MADDYMASLLDFRNELENYTKNLYRLNKNYLIEQRHYENTTCSFIPAPDREALLACLDKIEEKQSIPETFKGQLLVWLSLIVSAYSPEGWRLHIDGFENNYIHGWVKKNNDDSPQFISLRVNNVVMYECFAADAFRPDLLRAGIGTGCYGFKVFIDPLIARTPPALVSIQDCASGNTIGFQYFRM